MDFNKDGWTYSAPIVGKILLESKKDSTRIWEGKMDSDRMQNRQNKFLIEYEMDSIIMQNEFYHNVKWILSEFEKAKCILIECKRDSDIFFFRIAVWNTKSLTLLFSFYSTKNFLGKQTEPRKPTNKPPKTNQTTKNKFSRQTNHRKQVNSVTRKIFLCIFSRKTSTIKDIKMLWDSSSIRLEF